ncbi:MAG TPA: hypothetical protein VFN24_11685 [Microbacterium sp.]|nr:hypothetical protein [Microbacterium sp.]
MDVLDIASKVVSSAQLNTRGIRRSAVRALVGSGGLTVVHRGWYVDTAHWNTWFAESRHAARAIAVARSMQGDGTALSHTSAAVLHGLPLHRFEPARVHVVGARSNGRTRAFAGIARHEASVAAHLDQVHGLPVTSLVRTVADLIGRLPLEAAVAVADAALRSVAMRQDKHYDEDAAARLREKIAACSALAKGARGCQQARWVLAFADGRAQTPPESVSRLYFHLLGFAPPRLQVRIEHSRGYYEPDFALDDVLAWGEFDGIGKYTDPKMLGDQTTAEVLLDEKHREDDIRGRTGRPVIRWGSDHIKTVDAFRRRLESFHIRPPQGARSVASGWHRPRL